MRPESKKFVFDILGAAELLDAFTAGKTLEDYEADALLRSGVERQLEIVGEALSQLARIDPEVTAGIPEYRRIIAFRSILIHGYAQVDDRIVWDVLRTKLPELRSTLRQALGD